MKNIYYYFIVLCLLWAGGCQSVSSPPAVDEYRDMALASSPPPSPTATIASLPSPTPSVPESGFHLFNTQTGILGEIVVFSDRDGDNEIYIIDCASEEIRQLTDNEASDLYPSWSRNRERIVFVSDRDGNLELYVMAADGSSAERLTDNPEPDTFPAFSPDNESIVYFSRVDGKDTLRLMNVDSKSARTLTAFEDGVGGPIVFSSDGKAIFFCFERMDKHKIYSLDLPDGTPREIIAHANKNSRLSTIADPEGIGLLYVSGTGNQEDVWINYVEDGRFTQITKNTATDHSPSFSPDGRTIVFSSQRGGDNWQIYAVSREGKPNENEVIRITDDEFNYYYPECK